MLTNTITSRLKAWVLRLAASEETLALRQIEVQDARNSTPGSWDAKIYELTQELAAVSNVKASLMRELDLADIGRRRAQNALMPFGRVPATVWVDIFLTALTSCDHEGQVAFLRAITSTNHFWRFLALNAPTLWCEIVIRNKNSDFRRAHTYLHRSANALLNVTLLAISPYSRLTPTEGRELLQWISPHLQRCKNLTIVTGDYENARSMFPIRHPMPKLCTFIWEHIGRQGHPTPDTPIIVLDGSTSSPTSVRVQVAVGSNMLYSVRLGKSRLAVKDLTIKGGDVRTMREHMESLLTYPNLRSLIWGPEYVDREAEQLGQMGLRSESVEMIRLMPRLHPFHIFDRMETPRLRHLVLSTSFSHPMDIQGNIGPFPHLHTLWVETGWFSDSQILQLVDNHPTLEAIGSSSPRAILPVVQMLAKPISSLPSDFSLPRLSSFHIIYRETPTHFSPWLEAWAMTRIDSPVGFSPALINAFLPQSPQFREDPGEICRAFRDFLQIRLEQRSELEIRINNSTWTYLPNVLLSFETLALEYPNNVSLSAHPFDHDYLPHLFFPT